MNTFRELLTASPGLPLLIWVSVGLAACATSDPAKERRAEAADAHKLVADAQATFTNFMLDPDQTWIQKNLGRARGVLIAPKIVRAGFILGGSGGKAVLLAHEGATWVGPAFYNLATASVGFQAGVDVSEAIIVVMTEKGLNSLLSTSFKIGGDVSIAVGQVGAGATSTASADLISFTRAKGVYGGLNLDGTVVHSDVDANDGFYGGKGLTPPDILIRKTVHPPHATWR
jgi:lipid-binding SYLF domain-containing protein